MDAGECLPDSLLGVSVEEVAAESKEAGQDGKAGGDEGEEASGGCVGCRAEHGD